MKMELIEWIDSCGDVIGWKSIDDIDCNPIKVLSLGYVYKETKDAVLLIPHYAEETPTSSCQCRGEMTIAKRHIIKRTELLQGIDAKN